MTPLISDQDHVPRPSGLIALLTGLVLGVVIGFAFAVSVVRATPRDARLPSIPVADGEHLGAPLTLPHASASLAAPAMPKVAERAAAPTRSATTRSGTATYCAPTPRYCRRWGGDAHLGAVRSFTWGDAPYRVTVTFGRRSTTVLVVSYCACPATLIDLSPSSFDDLAPLWHGRIRVSVKGLR